MPLTVFPKELKESILKSAVENLSKNGQYIQFQYSLNAHKLLKEKFNSVKLAFSLINMPPAFVYKCSI
ncbi:MAG: phospholipid N-methyltransferase [Flavobacteriales bacterium]